MNVNTFVWFGDSCIPRNDATISAFSPSAQFGISVFEGIRCYWSHSHSQLFAFRLDDHIRRLYTSSKCLGIEPPCSSSDLLNAFLTVIQKNNFQTISPVELFSFFLKMAIGEVLALLNCLSHRLNVLGLI